MKNKTYIVKDLPQFCISYKNWKKMKNNECLQIKDIIYAMYIEDGPDYYFKISSNYLIEKIRKLIYKSFIRKNWAKTSKTQEILGCSFEEFKIYIEQKFTDGMNWENRGKWHFDHIYPVSLAKDEKELIRLNHFTNFQPLWAIDNLKKSNKIIKN